MNADIILLKYWLEVGQDEQTRRIESRINDPRKVWKLSTDGPQVLQPLVCNNSRARDEMLAATNTEFAPWYLADSNNKKRARLNIISHILDQIPYEPLAPPATSTLPEAAARPADYAEPDLPLRYIPAPF